MKYWCLLYIQVTCLFYSVISEVTIIKPGVTLRYSISNDRECQDTNQHHLFYLHESLGDCVLRCGLREQCDGLLYNGPMSLCQLFTGGEIVPSTGSTGHCVHIKRKDIEIIQTICNVPCSSNSVCDIKTHKCKVQECPKPQILDNGKVLGNRVDLGSTIQYLCNSGYNNSRGIKSAVCLDNGTWSDVAECVFDAVERQELPPKQQEATENSKQEKTDESAPNINAPPTSPTTPPESQKTQPVSSKTPSTPLTTPAASPTTPPTSPTTPPTSPTSPPTSSTLPPTSPIKPARSPTSPPTSPIPPPTSPTTPARSPTSLPTSPTLPPTSPTTPTRSPTTPPTSPTTPLTSPTTPARSPTTQSTSPTTPLTSPTTSPVDQNWGDQPPNSQTLKNLTKFQQDVRHRYHTYLMYNTISGIKKVVYEFMLNVRSPNSYPESSARFAIDFGVTMTDFEINAEDGQQRPGIRIIVKSITWFLLENDSLISSGEYVLPFQATFSADVLKPNNVTCLSNIPNKMY